MRMHPTISALRRHKAGVALIVLQVALTLAIVSNALFIVSRRLARIERPTGLDESGLVLIQQSWLDPPAGRDDAATEALDAMQLADLRALRQLPGVISVAPTDSLPLAGTIWSGDVGTHADQAHPTTRAAYYYGDQNLLPTLGLKLVAGRNFRADEVEHHRIRSGVVAPVVIITEALARTLFAQGSALGRTVYLDNRPTTVIGIVRRLQVPTTAGFVASYVYNSILQPIRLDGTSTAYVLRVRPGHEDVAMRAARQVLRALDPMRLMPDSWGTLSFSEIRDRAYRADRGTAMLLGTVCLILLCVTAAGIVGLTAFWVGQRRRQIGVRRALGARRVDILRHFQLENLLIVGAGVLLGVGFSVALNAWLVRHAAVAPLPSTGLLGGAALMLILGQAAVYVPARRAAAVAPVVATRAL